MKKIAILVVMIAIGFTSCSKSDDQPDTEKPQIDLHAPTDGAKIEAGDSHGIHFDMEVSDNVGLQSYKVDIHSAKGHTHSMGLRTLDQHADWAFEKTWDLGGQRNAMIHHHEIVVPEDAEPGEYHFVVYVLDVSGNQSMAFSTVEVVGQGEGDHDHDHTH